MALKKKGLGVRAINRELGVAVSSVHSVLAGSKPRSSHSYRAKPESIWLTKSRTTRRPLHRPAIQGVLVLARAKGVRLARPTSLHKRADGHQLGRWCGRGHHVRLNARLRPVLLPAVYAFCMGKLFTNTTAFQNCGAISAALVGIFNMIFAIVPPENAQQVRTPRQSWPVPGPRLSDHEHRLLAVVHQQERQTTTVWEAVSAVERDLAPRSRTDALRVRVTLLCALHRLVRQGRLIRVGRDLVKLAELPDPFPSSRPQPQPAPAARGNVFVC